MIDETSTSDTTSQSHSIQQLFANQARWAGFSAATGLVLNTLGMGITFLIQLQLTQYQEVAMRAFYPTILVFVLMLITYFFMVRVSKKLHAFEQTGNQDFLIQYANNLTAYLISASVSVFFALTIHANLLVNYFYPHTFYGK
jgi:flagellar biosynthesis protein FliQ